MSLFFFFSSRRRHTRFDCDWSSDVCSSDLGRRLQCPRAAPEHVVEDREGVEADGTRMASLIGERADAAGQTDERRGGRRRAGEGRGGEEGGSRGAADHLKKKKKKKMGGE